MINELGFYGGKSGRALAAAVEFELQSVKGWGSQGKPWLDRKNPNTNKGR